MAQLNLIYVLKRGTVGKTINFTLSDENGLVDLTGWTVTMSLQKGTEFTLEDAEITQRNQTTDRGECLHTWTADTSDLEVGTHRGNLKLTKDDDVLYWPEDQDDARTYFEVHVQEPIDAPEEP